jgi:hypothetical protein
MSAEAPPKRKVVISVSRSTLAPVALALALLLAVVSASAASGGTLNRTAADASHCKRVGKGHAWSYKGRRGTSFTVEGDRPSACAVGIAWLFRLTTIQGVPRTPPGWNCMTATADIIGQCDHKKTGAVFQWTYRRT